MTERSGIEIDYCPECRGVWLDRGELDKIIERAAPGAQPIPAPLGAPLATERLAATRPRSDHRDWDDDDDDDHLRHSQTLRKRKKKGLLGELFDF
jgi:Zn-finger nucleic acid-binding protein